MMIRDADVAALCRGIYAYPGDVPISWDHYDDGTGDGICWGVKRLDSIVDVVVFRGSRTLRDWILDFDTVADPFSHDAIGPVHPGFLLGIEQVVKEFTPMFAGACEVVITGHSLGAGRAAIMAGLMLETGWTPAAVVTFGQPKPGFAKLATIISRAPARWYCNGDANGHDLVTDVPLSFPPEEYVHSGAAMRVSKTPTPTGFAQDGMFAYHDMRLYHEAMGESSPIIFA
jgi:hypothetical protein